MVVTGVELLERHRNQRMENLLHYGVKGMKWGVRRTPEQLGHRPRRKNLLAKNPESAKLINEAVENGKISLKVNREKQMRHTRDEHIPGRSYIDGDIQFAQTLITQLSGTGIPIMTDDGEWTKKERVSSPHVIGTYVDSNQAESKTNAAMIVYSKTGSHIYPRKRDDSNDRKP